MDNCVGTVRVHLHGSTVVDDDVTGGCAGVVVITEDMSKVTRGIEQSRWREMSESSSIDANGTVGVV